MSKTIKEVEEEINGYIEEARTILSGVPDDLSFTWDLTLIVPGNGTGGTLLQPSLLGIGYDPDYEDQEALSRNLRATVLHECFHSVQGWSDRNPKIKPITLLEDGILEGAATAFERDIGGTTPEWSMYKDDATMHRWLDRIRSLDLDPNSKEYSDYKFGEVNGVRWMLYKLGTWIADKALQNNADKKIADLASLSAEEILSLANLLESS